MAREEGGVRHAEGVTTLDPSPFVARTPEQARLLLDLAYTPVLAVLMAREASAGEVARETESTVKRAHHRITRLLGAGLIEVTGERRRGGRPVKLYRAGATAYRVPFTLTDAVTMRELLEAMHRPLLDAYLRAQAAGYGDDARASVFVELDDQGNMSHGLGRRLDVTDHRRGFGTARTASLTPETIRELKRRLQELGDWVNAQNAGDDPQAQDCILALLFTPGRLEGL